MSATTLHRHWPATPSAAPASALRLGRELVGPGGFQGLQWVLKSRGAIPARQLGVVYLALCLVSLLASLVFWWQGARVVSAFAGTELLLVGVALLLLARHAGDREVLTLFNRRLAVEQHLGRRSLQLEFRTEGLSIEPAGGQGSLVELSCHGQTVRVGRFLRPDQRAGLAQELRHALRRASLQQHATGFELK